MSECRWHLIAALALALATAACSQTDIFAAKSTAETDPIITQAPDKDDDAIVTLDLGASLREHRLLGADPLPANIVIPTTHLKAVPVTAALQAVLSGTDISLSWNAKNLGAHLVTVANLSGSLPKVVDKVCAAARVFCDYRHGSLRVSNKETFVVALPPVIRSIAAAKAEAGGALGASNSMIDALNRLLGKSDKAQIDEQSGAIIYTTDVDGEDRVAHYLNNLRTGHPLIILRMHIWDVALNSDKAQGINWSSLAVKKGEKSAAANIVDTLNNVATTAGSVGLDPVTSGMISADTMASFLATQGRVQTVSHPQVAFISGASAQLKIGASQRYISQLGAVTNASQEDGRDRAVQTVSTDSLDTGLSLSVSGSYDNGIVFAAMELALRHLVSLNPTVMPSIGDAGSSFDRGTVIDLPQTTDEKISTVLRVRPGDSLVMAGLVTSSYNGGYNGGDDRAVARDGAAPRNNHELVMMIKPSIVMFADHGESEETDKIDTKNITPTSQTLPEAVVIDKDGVHPLAFPPLAPPAPPLPPPVVTYQLDETMPDADSEAMQKSATFPDYDAAPIDKNLMQRGFSRAVDQLMHHEAGEP